MDNFSKLTEYQLLEIQNDFKAILRFRKIITYVIQNLDYEEIEEITYYKRLF